MIVKLELSLQIQLTELINLLFIFEMSGLNIIYKIHYLTSLQILKNLLNGHIN